MYHRNIQVVLEFSFSPMNFDRVIPTELKKKIEIHFTIIMLTVVENIQLKFDMWMCHTNLQSDKTRNFCYVITSMRLCKKSLCLSQIDKYIGQVQI